MAGSYGAARRTFDQSLRVTHHTAGRPITLCFVLTFATDWQPWRRRGNQANCEIGLWLDAEKMAELSKKHGKLHRETEKISPWAVAEFFWETQHLWDHGNAQARSAVVQEIQDTFATAGMELSAPPHSINSTLEAYACARAKDRFPRQFGPVESISGLKTITFWVL